MAPRCEDDHLNVRTNKAGGAVRKKLIAAQASAKTYQDGTCILFLAFIVNGLLQ